ncbi:MAG: hypothetical protein LAO76_00170 [Acidobacteriia bacterium]|nr:hypothetical protein [Terriglobia bacterium]
MLLLFDHGTPAPLASFLTQHTVRKTKDLGRDTHGELLKVAEEAGFELLLTTDKNIRHQQNLTGRKIAILVLANPRWPVVRRYVQRVVSAVNAVRAGTYTEVEIPGK